VRSLFRSVPLYLCLAIPGFSQNTPGVGDGSPSSQIQTRFQVAFFRGNFANLVSQPPIANVHQLGTTGLVQEFYNSKKTSGVKAALILPDASKEGDVLQVYPDIYTYYSAVGVNAAGYPIEDTQFCPGVPQCTFQRFSGNYALFAFPTGNANGTQFQVSGNFYSKWIALNNVFGPLGLVANVQKSVTSSFQTTANYQAFFGGFIYDILSGTNKSRTFAVTAAVNALYQNVNGPAGPLGLPLGDELSLTGGIQRQLFEGGRIQYSAGGAPVLLLPVNEIQLSPLGPVSLKSGQTVTVTETAYDTGGAEAVGRTVSWSTTNGQVVGIQVSGNTAVLKGLGSGTAQVTATSEGKVSAPILITVTGPCCQIGEGSPSLTVGQAFQDAVARNRLSVQVPGPNPVQHVGSGYTQDLVSFDGTAHYLIAKADSSVSAYLVSGELRAAYLQAGGSTGSLGFPVSDASAAGVQIFQNGALAGSPLRVVSGAVLAKWASLRYDAGPAGLPTAAAIAFTSQSAFNGQSQAFANGTIVGISSGIRAGQGYFVSGAILARYLALSGPSGTLGIPTGDSFSTGGLQRQNFENGYIDAAAGAATGQEHPVPRSPAISANPAAALAGSRLHLSVSGFSNGATIRVSVAGQPDFSVATPNGSYDWDIYIGTDARSGSIAIHAVDMASGASVDGSYKVVSVADARPQLTKAAGDNQTGVPGTVLPVPVSVLLVDGSGTPLAGIPVAFVPSPGGQVSRISALTDSAGQASTVFRLPAAAGIAAVTASALGKLAIFNARAAGSPATASFPQFTQTSVAGPLGSGTRSVADGGAFLTSVAAVVRFYQNQGLLSSPNGLADPAALNQFLTKSCSSTNQSCNGFLSSPNSAEQVVNLWKVGAFVGGSLDVSVEDPAIPGVRDLAAAGSPVLLSLSLQRDGAPAGGTVVAAIGVSASGDLQIFDPNPVFGRMSLNEYITGFSLGGSVWKGSIVSAVRLVPRAPTQTGFVLASISQPEQSLPPLSIQSAAGSCGLPFVLEDAASATSAAPGVVNASEFLYCDGTQPLYQVSVGANQPFRAALTDLAPGGGTVDLSGSAANGYQVSRPGLFTVAAPVVNFTSAGIVNAASYSPNLAPGEIVSIFGSGLSGPGALTSVAVNGLPAAVISVSPFQVNAQIPLDLVPGTYSFTINSIYGSLDQAVNVAEAAPGIFVLGTNADGAVSGAIVNRNGAVNGPTAPVSRGDTVVVYCTGLGAVSRTAALPIALTPVKAVVSGAELPVAYAGLTLGFLGLYQVNVVIPAGTPPGLNLPFAIREAGQDSNTVPIAVQ